MGYFTRRLRDVVGGLFLSMATMQQPLLANVPADDKCNISEPETLTAEQMLSILEPVERIRKMGEQDERQEGRINKVDESEIKVIEIEKDMLETVIKRELINKKHDYYESKNHFALKWDVNYLFLNTASLVDIIVNSGPGDISDVAKEANASPIYGFTLGLGGEYYQEDITEFARLKNGYSLGLSLHIGSTELIGKLKQRGEFQYRQVLPVKYSLAAEATIYIPTVNLRETLWYKVSKDFMIGPNFQLQLGVPIIDGTFNLQASTRGEDSTELGKGYLNFRGIGFSEAASLGVALSFFDSVRLYINFGQKFEMYDVEMEGTAEILKGERQKKGFEGTYQQNQIFLGLSLSVNL